MYQYIKSLFFKLSPEEAHKVAMRYLETIQKIPIANQLWDKQFDTSFYKNELDFCGLKFSHPIGLAAGFDKNGAHIDSLSKLGFSFVEIGTVTPLAQEGNLKPRLFRLPKDEALINRMGFNNEGMDRVVDNLKKVKSKTIIGGNIGKNKSTANEDASLDYIKCFNSLFDFVDYFVVNVSSPNTPNLRALQDKAPLTELLNTLQKENFAKAKPKPILLKIAPDLNQSQLEDIIQIFFDTKIAGIVATNTTIERTPLTTNIKTVEEIGAGGLSGKPLRERSTEVIRFLNKYSDEKIPIIGVGGINHADHAKEKLDAGAKLLQIYSGFIYEGPYIVKNILKKL